MAELFKDCDRIAKGRKMGFSAIKTKWIGFGGTRWEDLDIDGELLTPVEDLRVLGYRFNVFLNMSSHVSYWLERGLGVVTGFFLSNENTIGPAVDLLALVLREASRDRR